MITMTLRASHEQTNTQTRQAGKPAKRTLEVKHGSQALGTSVFGSSELRSSGAPPKTRKRHLTRNQPKTNQKPTRNQPETIQKPTRNQPGTNQKPTGNQTGISQQPIRNQQGTNKKPTRNQPETNQKPTRNQAGTN